MSQIFQEEGNLVNSKAHANYFEEEFLLKVTCISYLAFELIGKADYLSSLFYEPHR